MMVLSARQKCKTKDKVKSAFWYVRNAKGTVGQKASQVSVLVGMALLSVTSSTFFFADSYLSYNVKFTRQRKLHTYKYALEYI